MDSKRLDIVSDGTDFAPSFVAGDIIPEDAALFSAAPAMLELLQTILLRIDMEPVASVFPCSAMREDIRAAIAKATAAQ